MHKNFLCARLIFATWSRGKNECSKIYAKKSYAKISRSTVYYVHVFWLKAPLPVTSWQAIEEKLCTAENVVALLNRSFRSARSPVSQ